MCMEFLADFGLNELEFPVHEGDLFKMKCTLCSLKKYLAFQRPSNRKSEPPPSAPCDTPENREWLRFKDLVDYG